MGNHHFFNGKNPLFRLGHFPLLFVCSPEGKLGGFPDVPSAWIRTRITSNIFVKGRPAENDSKLKLFLYPKKNHHDFLDLELSYDTSINMIVVQPRYTKCETVLALLRVVHPQERVKHERELWKEVVERRQQQPLQLALSMKESLGIDVPNSHWLVDENRGFFEETPK